MALVMSLQNRFTLADTKLGSDSILSASDAFFAATSIDVSARMTGVKRILESLPSTSDSGSVSKEHLDVLITLITDVSEDISVLQAVYTTAPESLASALLADQARFVADVVDALSTKVLPTADRHVLRLHLEFFAKFILPHPTFVDDVAASRSIIEKLFVPFLLLSKPKQKRVTIAWEIISSSSIVFEKIDILKGCAAIVINSLNLEANEGEAKSNSDAMIDINDKLVGKIAGTTN